LAFGVRRSAFGVRRSAFGVRRYLTPDQSDFCLEVKPFTVIRARFLKSFGRYSRGAESAETADYQ